MSEVKTLPYSDTNPDRAISVDTDGRMTYDGASREGRVEIELPSLSGSPTPTETLHAVNFGPHVASRIEAAMSRQGYVRSGPQQRPHEVFEHYISCAKGAELLDAGTLKRAETLSKEFSSEADQKEFYQMVVRQWLLDLTPGKR